MSSKAPGPGKTAPKLLRDLYLFDPTRIVQDYNVLRDAPPIWEEGGPQPQYLHKDACKHEYITLPNQSQIPQLDERPGKSPAWKVAAICQNCRLHATILLDFSHTSHTLCPNVHFPLHFFKFVASDHTDNAVQYRFVCTSWTCQVHLLVSYAPPTLDKDALNLLTNEDKLARRYRAILEEEPGRKDVTLTTPIEALHRLKRYTDDSLKPTHEKRQLPAHNKKFLGAFGSDCHDFLKELGFVYADAPNGSHVWQLPSPGLTVDPLRPDPHRASLENLSVELQILLDQMASRHGVPNPSPREPWHFARPDIERLLSAQSYDRQPGRVLRPTEQDHPCFAALGALGDFSDPLIHVAYLCQTRADPDNIPYYLDCLQQLAQGRQSEFLFTEVSKIASVGVVGRRDLIDAYKDLGASSDLAIARSMDDSYLIDLYRATMSDSGQERQRKLKQSLLKIGQSRDSKTILNVASDTIETYQDALSYLGADNNTGDEMITALYGSKIGDSPENAEMTKKAVKIIADKRQSASLQGFLTTGELNALEMDLDEACRHLNMTFDPNIDEGALNATFLYATEDRPGQRTDQAIAAVRKALEERHKFDSHAVETWPVGLESHGNTCYLNSLLQYYFTIKPLRDLVLEIDRHKFDLAKFETKSERVQSIHLNRYEIEAYQKFADHLKFLFERMIKTREPRVRPDTELVCGAFLTPNDSGHAKETDGHDGPVTDSVDADMGDVGVEKIEESAEVPPAQIGSTIDAPRVPSNASSATLIEEDEPPPAPAAQMLTPPASPKAGPPEPQDKPPLPPRPKLEKVKTQLELAEDAARRQQDVAEVMEDLLRRLRAAIKPEGQDEHGEQLDQLRDLFNMRFIETVIAEGESKAQKEEDATNILLNVPYEPTDIYSALDRVIDLRQDDIAGKPIEIYRSYTSLSPLLQISIPRIALQGGQAIKVNHSLRLEETLYMDRYCSDDQVLPIRETCWQLRRRLHSLQVQKELIDKTALKDVKGPDMLEDAAKYLSGVQEANEGLVELGIEPFEDTSDVVEGLEQEARELRSRLGPLDTEIQRIQQDLEGQFDMFTKEKYRLYAVFFHRGGAGGGHYWSNIFDFQANMWRTYNDETVEEHKNPADILNAREWQHGTPTYAVYVRDDVKDEIVQPVCREPEAEMAEQTDVQMTETQAADAAATAAGWDNVNTDSETKVSEGGWDDTTARAEASRSGNGNGNGNTTPKKRFSASPGPDESESPLKRHQTPIRIEEEPTKQQDHGTVSGSAFQLEQLGMDVHESRLEGEDPAA